MRLSPAEVIVAGDFNAKHSSWSSPRDDARGESLMHMAHSLDLCICNSGPIPTRERNGSQSYIYLCNPGVDRAARQASELDSPAG